MNDSLVKSSLDFVHTDSLVKSGLDFVHTDGLRSVVAKTRASAATVTRTRYEPYGLTAAGEIYLAHFPTNMKIFQVENDNAAMSLVPSDLDAAFSAFSRVNFEPCKADWRTLDFTFQIFDGADEKPNINMIYGRLAMHSDLQDKIFSKNSIDLEFLPISVSGESWLLVNCLRTTMGYDNENSILHRRGERNEIFAVRRVILHDQSVAEKEMFCLGHSNRTAMLVVPTFIDRVTTAKAHGIGFHEVGSLKV